MTANVSDFEGLMPVDAALFGNSIEYFLAQNEQTKDPDIVALGDSMHLQRGFPDDIHG